MLCACLDLLWLDKVFCADVVTSTLVDLKLLFLYDDVKSVLRTTESSLKTIMIKLFYLKSWTEIDICFSNHERIKRELFS